MKQQYWQLCPRCNGLGTVLIYPKSTDAKNFTVIDIPISNICPVCKGAMIISSVTGLPPSNIEYPNYTTGNENKDLLPENKITLQDIFPRTSSAEELKDNQNKL